MKKLLFILFVLPFTLQAQDSTNVSLTDSGKMYRYSGVYAVIGSVRIQPPYSGRGIIFDSTIQTKWRTQIEVKIYASKADFLSSKGELFVRYPQELYTDKIPTQKEIFDRFRTVIK
jgi:hypothetical protein